MTAVIDKEMLKKALRELFVEEPNTIKEYLREAIKEQSVDSENEFERLIQKNFNRFDATFKALA